MILKEAIFLLIKYPLIVKLGSNLLRLFLKLRLPVVPIIKNLLFEIRQTKGCYFSRITGSGSVSYGLFDD